MSSEGFADVIELSDSDEDDEIAFVSGPIPTQSPNKPPAPPPLPPSLPLSGAQPRGSLSHEPIDIDAIEPEIIDLTDSPARETVALFDELPQSTEATVSRAENRLSTAPFNAVGTDSTGDSPQLPVADDEPPPSSPEMDAMEIDVDSGGWGIELDRTPERAQSEVLSEPLKQPRLSIVRTRSPTQNRDDSVSHARSRSVLLLF